MVSFSFSLETEQKRKMSLLLKEQENFEADRVNSLLRRIFL